MFRTLALAGVLALALGPELSHAPQTRRVDLEAADCSQINMTFGDNDVARAEQRITVPVSVGTLEIRPDGSLHIPIRTERSSAHLPGV